MRTLMMMIAILILAAVCAEGHDIYSGLMDRSGASCCNETDCHPANYRISSAGVDMFVDNEWVRVPNNVIQYRSLDGDTGETRGGHWCGVTYWKQQNQVAGVEYPPTLNHPGLHPSGFSTRCVILPPELF